LSCVGLSQLEDHRELIRHLDGAGTLLARLREYKPQMAEQIARIADAWDPDRRAAVMGEVWPAIEKTAFDYSIAEPLAAEGGVAMVPGGFGWDDVGDFNSLAALLPEWADREKA